MIGARAAAVAEYIYSADPSLDGESQDFDVKKYLETFERKHLPTKPGSTPTVFKIHRLRRKRFMAIAGMPESERANAAVAYGVCGIENFRDGHGGMLVPEFVGDGSDRHLTADTLDAIFDSGLFGELMNIVLLYSGLDPLADRRSGSSPG